MEFIVITCNTSGCTSSTTASAVSAFGNAVAVPSSNGISSFSQEEAFAASSFVVKGVGCVLGSLAAMASTK